MENQAIFPNYVDSYISKNKIVPGQGYARDFKKSGYDYAIASGYFSLDFSKIFTMQFGHGKHFIEMAIDHFFYQIIRLIIHS